ncbi:hypothetical protein BD311DRAFT_757672 [Dichomitus squalens]|uniref:Uncharacterized protein n=1 Tax=Dichomitus squalens TaxID=114155 RepID=A0A4Q9MMY7_9APHY|nr:hypothetical protein BD311DRAFT_757672 [Dichomitus squalens]
MLLPPNHSHPYKGRSKSSALPLMANIALPAVLVYVLSSFWETCSAFAAYTLETKILDIGSFSAEPLIDMQSTIFSVGAVTTSRSCFPPVSTGCAGVRILNLRAIMPT